MLPHKPTNEPALHRACLRCADERGDQYSCYTRTAIATACAEGLMTVGMEMGGDGTVRPDIFAPLPPRHSQCAGHFDVLSADASATIAPEDAALSL
jgi:hypothetical protein